MTEPLFFVSIAIVAGLILAMAPVMLIVERRGSAFMQRRVGPNRVGPLGLMQPMADALKLIFKEDLAPEGSHPVLFPAAPAIGVVVPFLALAAVPFAGTVLIDGMELPVQLLSINVGLLYLLAITSLHVFSVLAAGYSSNNKFSLLGALRSSSQMISYEIAIGVSVVSVVLVHGTLDLREIVVRWERGLSWAEHLCLVLPFLVIWISSFAETNRLPFDLPEGESELVAGYHTEYSGLKWAMFFLGEYAAMTVASALMATLFLGGYWIPGLTQDSLRALFVDMGYGADVASYLQAAVQLGALLAKIGFFMFVFVWVRWTLPRFRYDQLMDLGWRVLLPVGVANAAMTFVVTYFRNQGILS